MAKFQKPFRNPDSVIGNNPLREMLEEGNKDKIFKNNKSNYSST